MPVSGRGGSTWGERAVSFKQNSTVNRCHDDGLGCVMTRFDDELTGCDDQEADDG